MKLYEKIFIGFCIIVAIGCGIMAVYTFVQSCA